jgi:hypothetical protein
VSTRERALSKNAKGPLFASLELAAIQIGGAMSTYAVAHLRRVTLGPEISLYLETIDATLEPYGGRFLVHGGEVEVLEGTWPGHLIIIEFPDR